MTAERLGIKADSVLGVGASLGPGLPTAVLCVKHLGHFISNPPCTKKLSLLNYDGLKIMDKTE